MASMHNHLHNFIASAQSILCEFCSCTVIEGRPYEKKLKEDKPDKPVKVKLPRKKKDPC